MAPPYKTGPSQPNSPTEPDIGSKLVAVIVYTKANCQPCNLVKRLLVAEGIGFEERNAVDHADYLASIGAKAVPIIVDGDQVIHGFDPDQLRALNQ